MKLMSRIRGLPVAPSKGSLSAPLSTAGMHAVRAARRAVGGRVGAQAADVSTPKIVSRRYRFILVTIPKVGTKSLQHTFLGAPEFSTDAFGIDGPPDALEQQVGDLQAFHKAVFVRNPWARAASCYYDKIVRSHQFGKITILSRYPGLYPKMPFREFVDWLVSPAGADEYADRHWISQHKLFTVSDGNCLVDDFYKIESITREFARFCGRVGLPPISLGQRNAGGGTGQLSQDHHAGYFDPETIDLIARRYQKDIELFGYEFDSSIMPPLN